MAFALLALLLAACGGGGEDVPPAPTVTLSASPVALTAGAQVTLVWSSINATSCTASGAWSGAKATSGSQGVATTTAGTIAFSLACSGAGGSATQSVAVTVNSPPPVPTLTLLATPATVTVGAQAMLTWNSSNATSCTATGAWSGDKATSGSEQFNATAAGAFTHALACTGPGGNVSQSVVVTVTPPGPPAPTISITSSAASLTPGDVFTLTWSTTNATACTASNSWSGSRGTSGSQSYVSGQSTGTYVFTLTCTGPGGSTQQALSIANVGGGATLSGNLLVPANTQTDSDTNESRLTPVANNTIATAQPLPTTVVLGGYVNRPGAGPEGPLRSGGDPEDYFSASLVAGQVIELGFADAGANDLDLFLLTPEGTVVDESVGVDTVERITVAASGNYLIIVEAFSGASNYILTIGQPAPGITSATATLSAEFAPGELLVGFRDAAGMATASAQAFAAGNLVAAHGLAAGYDSPAGYSLLKLAPERVAQFKAGGGAGLDGPFPGTRYRNANDGLKAETLRKLKTLQRDPQVAWAESNRLVRATVVPNDPFYASQQRWHYEQISLPDAWNVTTGDGNTIVAVVDSGVRPHADLAARLVYPYDFATLSPGDGDGDDPDASDPGKPVGSSYSFHGTHVAGTIGAAGNDGAGVTGVAWNVRIMPVRALGTEGVGFSSDIIEAIRYAAGLSNRSGTLPAQRADIINLSLGSSGSCGAFYANTFSAVRAAGVMVVAAAGNEAIGSNIPPASAPANCAGVIAVSAVGRDGTRASYSNAGTGVDVAAPGGDSSNRIFSTWAERVGTTYSDSFAGIAGTSMATPHVAGVLALMKAVNPALTPDVVDNLLASGALTDDIGPPGADELGIGLINAFKAVVAASGGSVLIPGQLGVSTTALNFGDVATSAEVQLRNSGTQPVAVTGISTSAAWLAANAVQVDASGLGRYAIVVNRAALASGTYSGHVDFTGSSGTAVRVNVLVEVRSSALQPDAGMHIVVLYDLATRAARKQVTVHARGSAVPYQFIGVQPGTYGVIAGTDIDNDGFLCDENEACAEFPVYASPAAIIFSGSVAGADMATAYRPRYSGSSSAAAAGDERKPPSRAYRIPR